MPSDPTSHLVTWRYADWRSESTAAQQLERLKMHLQEVSGFVLESAAKGRSLKLQQEYLPMLQKEQARLESMVAIRLRSGRFGVSSFNRGSGP